VQPAEAKREAAGKRPHHTTTNEDYRVGTQLLGKNAIISGGARGIGAATARRFVAEGARVIIGDILEGDGKALADELGENARFVRLDVRAAADWEAAVELCKAEFGLPQVLVSNAGLMVVGPIESATEDDYRRPFEVHVMGAFLGTRAVIEPMRQAGGGSIVVISSSAGYSGVAGMAAYAASKAGNNVFAQCAALELGHYGIRVNTIVPGGFDTPMQRSEAFANVDIDAVYGGYPLGRLGKPEELANAILFLASSESSYATGATLVVDGGMLAGPQVSP
jgi:3alpha(or 20beta)-hydroxysteroid dehydrogenase